MTGSTFRSNWLGVKPGDPAFNILTNMCDYFRLGEQAGEDVWLEGQIVDGEFVFNGRLFLHDGQAGTVIDDFPKGPAPQGWTKRPKVDVEGYELVDGRGELVFSYHVDGTTCIIDVDLYQANGERAAHGGQGGLVAHIPIQLGRNGIVSEPG